MIKIFQGLFFVLMVTVSSFAQETTGGLQGTVMDLQNKPVSFANITVVDTETNFKYGTTSQENGFYIITNLAPSSLYRIEISFIGYQTITEERVVVNLGSITEKIIPFQKAISHLVKSSLFLQQKKEKTVTKPYLEKSNSNQHLLLTEVSKI